MLFLSLIGLIGIHDYFMFALNLFRFLAEELFLFLSFNADLSILNGHQLSFFIAFNYFRLTSMSFFLFEMFFVAVAMFIGADVVSG